MFELSAPQSPAQWEQYFDLRWRILRQPWQQPRGSERDEFDDPTITAHHVAAWDAEGGELLGVGRLHQCSSHDAQIRYMAVESAARGQGIGRAIVARLEERAAEQSIIRIVLNARNEVVGFYEQLGYAVIEPGPTMFGNVEHSLMEKWLPVSS